MTKTVSHPRMGPPDLRTTIRLKVETHNPKRTDEQTNRRTDEQTNRRTDEQTNTSGVLGCVRARAR